MPAASSISASRRNWPPKSHCSRSAASLFDAAIIFSDILVIPYALGRNVTFEAGEGPRLDPLDTPEKIGQLAREADFRKLEPVFEALARVRGALSSEVALIGFCGAPWTVATYMVAGHGTPDQAPARLTAYRHPEAFAKIIDALVENSVRYLLGQLEAGADALQIFDTWAGILPTNAGRSSRRVASSRASAGRDPMRRSSAFRAAPVRCYQPMFRRLAWMLSASTGPRSPP